MIKPAIALCISLAVPSAAVLADDELTQELHGNIYQENSTSISCANAVCTLTFGVTQHITTVVTNINCNFLVSAGAQVSTAKLYTKNSYQNVSVPVSFLGNDGNSYTFLVINSQLNYFINKGDAPMIQVGLISGSLIDISCLISGYHS